MMKPVFKTVQLIDHVATGKRARDFRRKQRARKQPVADRLGITLQMIWLLERGKRSWTTDFLSRYETACREAGNPKLETVKPLPPMLLDPAPF